MNFCKIFLLSLVFLLVNVAPGDAQKNSATPSSPVVTKKALQNHIVTIEKELKNIKDSLDKLETKKKKKKEGFLSFIEGFSLSIMAYLVDKGEGLKEGVLSLEKFSLLFFHVYTIDIWYKGGWFLFKFLIACLCGAAAYFLIFQGIRKFLNSLLKGEKQKTLPRFFHLIIEFFLFSLPLLAFALIETSVFFLNEANPILRNGAISLTVGCIFLWMTWYFTNLMVQYRFPFLTIFPTDRRFSGSFSFWVRGIILFYVIGGWGVELAALIGIPDTGQKVLLNIFGLGWTICILFLIQIIRRPFIVALSKNKKYPFWGSLAPLWPTLISGLAIGLYVFWTLDDGSYFEPFFWLILMTAYGIPLGHFLYRELRRLRLGYVWPRRHDKVLPPFYNLLASHLFFNRLSKWGIYGSIFFFIFEIWGFEFLFLTQDLFSTKLAQQIIEIVLVFSAAYVLMRIGDRVLDFYLGKKQTTDSIEADYIAARFRTILKILKTLLRVGIWIPVTLIILSVFNYDTTPLLASVGIITAGLTFGAQSIVKDFLSGFLLILEKSLVVGDQVEIDGKSGTVEDLTLRILRVRMDNGTLLTIPFGHISVIGNKSRYFAYTLLNISVGYKEDPDAIQQLLEKAYQILRKTPADSRKILAPLEIRGIIDVTDYSMVFQARLKTAPGQQDFVKRAFNRALKQIFDEAGVKIPSPAYPYMEKTSPSLTNTVP